MGMGSGFIFIPMAGSFEGKLLIVSGLGMGIWNPHRSPWELRGGGGGRGVWVLDRRGAKEQRVAEK